MITVSILEQSDVILPTDWCRPLVLQTMSGGMSDSMSFKACYSGTPENNVEWVPANRCFGPVWFASPTTVGEVCVDLNMQYEFVRGEVPVSHRLSLDDYTDLRDFG